jgi:hypothetical protein
MSLSLRAGVSDGKDPEIKLRRGHLDFLKTPESHFSLKLEIDPSRGLTAENLAAHLRKLKIFRFINHYCLEYTKKNGTGD